MRIGSHALREQPSERGTALDRGAGALSRMQRADGSWEGECVWCPMLTAQYTITAEIIGVKINPSRRAGILAHFVATRNGAGVWGLHPFDEGSLFVTTLVYVAARLLGVSESAEWLQGARQMFEREGGVQRIPTWGKIWLALLGLYPWEGVNPIPPEVWALPARFPLHPANYYCHTRSIYLGLAVLYAQRFVASNIPVCSALQTELYAGRYDLIDFPAFASSVRKEDAPFRASAGLRMLFGLSRLYERVQLESVRARVLDGLRQRMRSDLRASSYLSLSPVNGLLSILALWSNDPDDADVEEAIAGLDAWFWEDAEEGSRVAGAGSVCWDTSFALQALSIVPVAGSTEALARGSSFLAGQQIAEAGFDYRAANRIDPSGGWCFSEARHGWPVSDCTAEALIALLQTHPECLGQEDTARACRFILRCQNPDGGFGSYEPSKTSIPLEWMNPSEMFGGCMVERSYVECTASSLIALREVQDRYPNLLRHRIQRAMDRARTFLVEAQNLDGTWDAAWGVQYIYATMFGVRGLLAGGIAPSDQRVRKPCRWLLAHQRLDGGWGEHHASRQMRRYVDAPEGLPVQTAWALITLVEAREPNVAPLVRAARFLELTQLESGEWPDGQFVGLFFETALLNYRLYRQYFPVMALALLRRFLTDHDQPGRPHASPAPSSRA